ncbi:MAG: cell division protein FtsA [Chloroflexota bacterium]
MGKRTTIAAIDVGTTKICTTVAEVNEGRIIRVSGVGIVPSSGMHKGLVVSIGEARDAIRDSVKRAEQTSGYKIESAYVGVTGRHVTSSNNRAALTITRNDKMVRPSDLKRVMQFAQNIKIPEDRKLIHAIPRSYAVDGQTVVKNPVGMHGLTLDVEAHIITAAINSIQNLARCVRSLGIDIEDLVLEPLASGEAVLTPEEKQTGVIMADIGGGTTDVAIFREGAIWHTAVIPVAGYQLTRDIAIGLGLPFDVAEEMKRQYGNVLPANQIKKDEAIPVVGNGHTTSERELYDILYARVGEIVKLILLELPPSEYHTLVPSGLVLTGGSSNLAGIDSLAKRILRLPSRVGAPVKIAGLTDGLADPAYATNVGLLLWGVGHQDDKSRQSLDLTSGLRQIVGQIKKLISRQWLLRS